MNVPATIVISILGLCFTALAFLLGQKKSNRDDGQALGEFMGEFRADRKNMQQAIAEIKRDIREIKEDRLGIDDAIKRAIAEHERVFHSKG